MTFNPINNLEDFQLVENIKTNKKGMFIRCHSSYM